jgi:hypothetical protein
VPALDVLAAESDGGSVDDQRCERKRFGVSPVDASGLAHRVATTTQYLRELRVWLDGLRPRQQLLIERDELVCARGGNRDRFSLVRPFIIIVRGRLVFLRRRLAVNAIEIRGDFRFERLHFFVSDDTFFYETACPHLAHARM